MSEQTPIHSGYGATTTATEALGGRDLSGVTAIVTGGYSGLGLETARVLARAGANVVVPARNASKAQEAVRGIPRIELALLDLLDPNSIDAFAAGFLASGRPLHILVNNAAIMATPLQRDVRGNESQFATNHLGHFHLTVRLWSALRRAEGARVVSVSSRGHRLEPVNFDDPNFERRTYDKWRAYAQSKSANALFAVGLDRRGEPHGVRAFSLHPGSILTDLVRHLDMDDFRNIGALNDEGEIRPKPEAGYKTVEQGAATLVWCAANPQLDGIGGVYCEDCDVAEMVSGDSEGSGVRAWAIDRTLAERLWTLSERLVCIEFNFNS